MASCKRAVCTAKHHSGESDSTQKYERKLERIVKFITQKMTVFHCSCHRKFAFIKCIWNIIRKSRLTWTTSPRLLVMT